ncbi:MAG TPA: hypothetical protein VFM60_07500, partial [Salinimicrobium sp.]|nr:hypothetical protein [Salinimicrobium sp.]
ITYRSNLARLIQVLLAEGKQEKAETILDLGMEKMPVEYFGYYFLLEPYISGYYEIGQVEKARALWEAVAEKYQQNLDYYSSLNLDRQFRLASEIVSDIERYRSLINILIIQQDEEIIDEKVEEFNNYLLKFQHFYRDEATQAAPGENPEQAAEEEIPENADSIE